MASSHVKGDAHEELDALVSDLVEGSHFLTETSSVVATSGLSGYDLNTAMPVASVGGERERGRDRQTSRRDFNATEDTNSVSFQSYILT